jgi:hypothetical protein
MTLGIIDTQHNKTLHNAECLYAEWRVLFFVKLSVVMLNGVMMSVVLLNDVMLSFVTPIFKT